MAARDHSVEIVIEPYRKIVIHEIIEYRLGDWLDMILLGARAAGGTTMPLLQWCNGIIFQIQSFNPMSETIIKESLEGTVHYQAVAFAVKERFEGEIRTNQGTVRLFDASSNPNFVAVAELLKARSKYKS